MNLKKFKKNLTAIVLCGGRGERLKPITNKIPKPLVRVAGKEILGYILKHLKKYQINDTLVLTGYKQELINKFIKKNFKSNVKNIYTGQKTDIIKRLDKGLNKTKKYILLCYGDTLLDINIDKLINFHKKNINRSTMSIFQNQINFGIVKFNSKNVITKFDEKPNLNLWINVGYFIFEKKELEIYCKKFNTFQNFLKFMGKKKKIKAYQHRGKHITINSSLELQNARKEIKKFLRK